MSDQQARFLKISELPEATILGPSDLIHAVTDASTATPKSKKITRDNLYKAMGGSVHSTTFTIGASTTWNNDIVPIWQGPLNGSYLLIEMNATTLGSNTPTLSFNLQRRDFTAMWTGGTDIFAASQTAASTGLSQTSFGTSVIGPRNHLMLTTGSGVEGGSVNYLTITLFYSVGK